MSNIVNIHTPLFDEGVDVWRPVQAEHLHDNVYRITALPYDRSTGAWGFGPGDLVLCDEVDSRDGPIIAATRRTTK